MADPTITLTAGPDFTVTTPNGETLLTPITSVEITTSTGTPGSQASSEATITAGVLTIALTIPQGEAGTAGATPTLNHLISGFSATTPAANAVLGGFVAPVAMTVAANFTSSVIKAGTAPAADFTVTVNVNGSAKGTLVLHTDGTSTLTSAGFTLAAGDLVTLVAPGTADTAVANVGVTVFATQN